MYYVYTTGTYEVSFCLKETKTDEAVLWPKIVQPGIAKEIT